MSLEQLNETDILWHNGCEKSLLQRILHNLTEIFIYSGNQNKYLLELILSCHLEISKSGWQYLPNLTIWYGNYIPIITFRRGRRKWGKKGEKETIFVLSIRVCKQEADWLSVTRLSC